MLSLLADLRYSAKSLARTPGLTLVLLLTIALGIGANAAVFGFIRGLVARNVPLPWIDRTVSLFGRDARNALGPVSYEGYLAIKTHGDAFDALGAARETRNSVAIGERSSEMSVANVTPELADLLQLPLAGGVVISRRSWQNDFAGRTTVRGETIHVDGVQLTVAGIAPDWLEGLYVGRPVDIWMLVQPSSLQGGDRTSRTFWAVGRLREGTSLARAQAVLTSPDAGGDPISVLPYTGLAPDTADGMSRLATLLPAAAAAVFLIACANVAAFLLSRASARSQETAVRVALGASRRQLGQQLLVDSLLLSVVGGACGIFPAVWTAQIIPALFFVEDAEHLVFAPSIGGIMASSAACAAVMVACGLLPLVEIRDDAPALVLRRESAGPSPVMRRVRAGLVVAQMACCCLLVISTGLLLDGFRTALGTSTGNRLGRPVLATLVASPAFTPPDLGLQYFAAAEQTVRVVPGVFDTAWMSTAPGSRAPWRSVRVEPPRLPFRDAVMNVVAFTPQTLPLIVTPPVAGRMFGGADSPRGCRVAIVNPEASRAFFGGNAVGRSIEDAAGRHVEIIGVVAARRTETATDARPTLYYYAQQTGMDSDQNGPGTFRIPVYPEPAARGVLDSNVVSPGFFGAMGVSPVQGKLFPGAPAPGACRVAVINEEAAELYFGGDAVGGAVIDPGGQRTTILGIVHSPPLRATQRLSEPAIYLPMTQDYVPRMTLMIGTRDAGDTMIADVQRRLGAVDGGGAPAIVRTLEAQLSRTALASERIAAILVGASAATALALGVVGIYGALADFARQRRREIALRIALGAQGWRVVRQVVRQGIRLAAIGAVAGCLASIPVARWLARIAPQTGSTTMWIWLAVPLVLIVVVAVASVLPVGRALAVDPLTIMRDT